MTETSNNVEDEQECVSCEVKFTNKTELKEHMETEHTQVREHCSLKVKTKSLLRIHNNSMHVFECEVCKEKKHTQDDLNKHLEDQHTFTCPVCNVKLHKKADLDKHQVEMHTCCSLCMGKFETKERISCHMLKHHTYIWVNLTRTGFACSERLVIGSAYIWCSHLFPVYPIRMG